ncbi:M23 family metallopeptidase [Palleronia sediminis]|uniref:M23 family metallopeptidase n=1 Tax=Palleronia sediminis TaxID=2547833 RepID=A0A4R6AK63_9RHOB|nr:M23 family metallopeptidase [Palleronia sediminis]TDL81853.1 M23 family metallopeptidase [Palleronia sediminis]
MRGAAAIAAALAAAPVSAAPPELTPPLDCDLGAVCYIQQYVDRDPGAGARDFTCGPLANDGHKGTDFALPSLAAMTAGVDVVAAAPGVVTGVRDGMADIALDDPEARPLDGRDCGNGLVIDHGAGWETQYCHLMRDSLAVAAGDTVERGDRLGRVGLSGATTYPHVHLSVRHDGETVDPFAPGTDECGTGAGTLWRVAPDYAPGGLIAAGFHDGLPEFDEVEAGTAAIAPIAADAPALVVWGYAFGGREGDEMALRIEGPEGFALSETQTIEKSQPQLFRAVGRRAPASGLPRGRYEGQVSLSRDGAEIDARRVSVTVE